MSATTATRLTFADLERLPETACRPGTAARIVNRIAASEMETQRVYGRLLAVITEAHARGTPGHLGKVHLAMGYRFEDDGWLIPDVSITYTGQQAMTAISVLQPFQSK
jgi:hypothetical protein